MEPFSTLDHASLGTGATTSTVTGAKTGATPMLAGAAASSGVRFPGEDAGRSLAEMAQRDLDAALQLLADRAQYITGASGAAIALRRTGRNDMLCRASAGLNAPELGALLSTEFGLSGESVRTRQALRCDDAERDARVNREVCREMGIASVVVMPVVNDDEVLGVFELFSGEANAFGVRDVSAIQRLSEMVETAVRLARASENLPERLNRQETSGATKDAAVPQAQDLKGEVLEEVVGEELVVEVAAEVAADEVRAAAVSGPVNATIPSPATSAEQGFSQHVQKAAPVVEGAAAVAPVVAPEAQPVAPAAEAAPAKKKLFWSAALNPVADAGQPEEADQSHVPPVLRSLHKCEACGFPVSAGRVLCVECEEKKWRGQLRVPRAVAGGAGVRPPVAPVRTAKPEARAFAAAAQSAAVSMPSAQRASAAVTVSAGIVPAPPAVPSNAAARNLAAPTAVPASPATSLQASPPKPEAASPEFVLSAGLEPSQSWLAEHKVMIAVLLVVAAAGAIVYFLR